MLSFALQSKLHLVLLHFLSDGAVLKPFFSICITADAGKSTTGGQILLLSGQVDHRTIQKYEKEAKDKNRESW